MLCYELVPLHESYVRVHESCVCQRHACICIVHSAERVYQTELLGFCASVFVL